MAWPLIKEDLKMKLLVTGGAGFIGSCFVIQQLKRGNAVLNLDKLTYSGNLANLKNVELNSLYSFVKGDICDRELVRSLLADFQPDAVVNFAAETHVDRSILDPEAFVKTNVLGTEALLGVVKTWWQDLPLNQKKSFRFHHISTDEVYGTLSLDEPAFEETTRYAPNSPYSASKASSDFFVRAFHETYGLPTLITNCSNNYGPRQFPEKLIPLMVLNALEGKSLPIYGKGDNIRDWLHVEDHCDAIWEVLIRAQPGETFNIGGNSERKNIDIVKSICSILDELRPKVNGGTYIDQIVHVEDRLGHDFRYAINPTKIRTKLGWSPKYTFEDGLRKTIQWYLDNPDWVQSVKTGDYQKWVSTNYTYRERRK